MSAIENYNNISVRELVSGYINNDEQGVVGFNGKLNIRPPYQREFVYNEKQQRAVIGTIIKNRPLSLFYWAKNEDGTFELLDGQQRTLSICEFVVGGFSLESEDGTLLYFHNLSNDMQNKILDYEITTYICDDNLDERLEWFRTINIAGTKLTEQELRNINYTGLWLEDAKRKFSKSNCVAYKLGSKYIKGVPIRQEYFETALKWISNNNITEYMSKHHHDANANELWLYYQSVINWVETTFGIDTNPKNYRKEMQSVEWGYLYNKYKDNSYDAKVIEARVNELMSNEEVTEKKGVYEYILGGEDKDLACKLSKRSFSERDKRTAYEKQKGICAITNEWFAYEDMQADHIVPWWNGGTTTLDNLQMVSKVANARKSGKI